MTSAPAVYDWFFLFPLFSSLFFQHGVLILFCLVSLSHAPASPLVNDFLVCLSFLMFLFSLFAFVTMFFPHREALFTFQLSMWSAGRVLSFIGEFSHRLKVTNAVEFP